MKRKVKAVAGTLLSLAAASGVAAAASATPNNQGWNGDGAPTPQGSTSPVAQPSPLPTIDSRNLSESLSKFPKTGAEAGGPIEVTDIAPPKFYPGDKGGPTAADWSQFLGKTPPPSAQGSGVSAQDIDMDCRLAPPQNYSIYPVTGCAMAIGIPTWPYTPLCKGNSPSYMCRSVNGVYDQGNTSNWITYKSQSSKWSDTNVNYGKQVTSDYKHTAANGQAYIYEGCTSWAWNGSDYQAVCDYRYSYSEPIRHRDSGAGAWYYQQLLNWGNDTTTQLDCASTIAANFGSGSFSSDDVANHCYGVFGN